MIRALTNWIDDRTGLKKFLHEMLYENIPGGARWRYVTGSMLVFAFVTQAITGIFLWMCYSPGSQNAYESVYWIQNELTGGWLLRGIHHFMAQAMVALLPIHLLQVVIDKAYRPPREFNFWTGMLLMLITLALSLTGYLLPWDQKGYWATKVATNLMALAPGGEMMQKLVVGGNEYGHYTLTRFFALHTGVLPAALVTVLVLHLVLFRRHGITAHPSPKRPDQFFWPYQVLKDSVASFVLLGLVLLLVIRFDVGGLLSGSLHGPDVGAHLSAPANQVEDYKAARPEWYFLFLFQFLKKFEENEFLGAIVIPGLVVGYMFLMPLIARAKVGHYLNLTVLGVLLVGIAYLTGEAIYEDNYASYNKYEPEKYQNNADALSEYEDKFQSSRDYLAAVEQGDQEYERLRELVSFYGIPREGVATLLANDPETQGPRLFAAKCASCHSYLDAEGHGIAGPPPNADGTPGGAPNLYKFASRAWLQGFLDPAKIVSRDYFGHTAHGQKDQDGNYPSGGMVEFVQDTVATYDDTQKQQLADLIVAISAEGQLPYQKAEDDKARADGVIARGKQAFLEIGCADCHELGDEGTDGAPTLTGYGSVNWLVQMIANPEHESLYDDTNDRMPAFAADPSNPKANLLSQAELELLAKWLRGDAAHLND